jgi:hypothetical protein
LACFHLEVQVIASQCQIPGLCAAFLRARRAESRGGVDVRAIVDGVEDEGIIWDGVLETCGYCGVLEASILGHGVEFFSDKGAMEGWVIKWCRGLGGRHRREIQVRMLS